MVFYYSTVDWWNNVIFPSITSLVLIALYWLLIATKSEPKNSALKLIYVSWKQIRLQYDSFYSTILIPAIVAIILFAIFISTYALVIQKEIIYVGYPKLLGSIVNSLLVPFNEEIFFRGLIFWALGITLATLLWKILDWLKKKSDFKEHPFLPVHFVYVVIVIQGLIFSYFHFDQNFVVFLLKILMGIVYGCLFYFNNKNLLPAMVSHGVYNVMIIAITNQPLI